MQRVIYLVVVLVLAVCTKMSGQETSIDGKVPDSWNFANDIYQSGEVGDQIWWKNFNDPILDSLIDLAKKNNYDLLGALNKVEMAKANMRISQGNFYPHLSIDADYSPTGYSSDVSGGTTHYGSASATMSWEVDIAGSIRNRAKSEKQNFQATKEQYNYVMISLYSQIAINYTMLRTFQQQLSVANQNLLAQEEILKVTEERFRTGLCGKIDVLQATTVYASTKATIPAIEALILQQINQLGVLVGNYPWSMKEYLSQISSIPEYEGVINVGNPSDLLRNRPDVKAAEMLIDAQASMVGASKSDWFPKVYVNGSIGYLSENFKDFVASDKMQWTIAPSIKWNFFNGGQLSQMTKMRQAMLDECINNYNETVMVALQEVDNAMTQYIKSLEIVVANKEAYDSAERTMVLSLDLYKQGLIDFQTVMDATRYLLTYANNVVNSTGNVTLEMIGLYKSLGGGIIE